MKTARILAPDVEPHDNPSRVIGRRTTYCGDEHPYLWGHDVVVVAIRKGALRVDEHEHLSTDEQIREGGYEPEGSATYFGLAGTYPVGTQGLIERSMEGK